MERNWILEDKTEPLDKGVGNHIIFLDGWKNWAYLVRTKDNLGRTWEHEVSKPYKLPCRGRMKSEIQNKVICRNADSDLI